MVKDRAETREGGGDNIRSDAQRMCATCSVLLSVSHNLVHKEEDCDVYLFSVGSFIP